jgi:hypothetical protein
MAQGVVGVLFILIPLVGILLYLIIYGDEMRVHAQPARQEQDRMLREYVRHAAGSYSAADELSRSADLKANGTINDEEFERLKSKIVNA